VGVLCVEFTSIIGSGMAWCHHFHGCKGSHHLWLWLDDRVSSAAVGQHCEGIKCSGKVSEYSAQVVCGLEYGSKPIPDPLCWFDSVSCCKVVRQVGWQGIIGGSVVCALMVVVVVLSSLLLWEGVIGILAS